MADTEAKKILEGAWADTGDRTDPDDTGLMPALVRLTGWPSSFSSQDGNKLRRRVMNQRFRELDGAASDSMRFGLLPYDAEINYHQHARCTVGANEYRATRAVGPDIGSGAVNPTDSGQTAWVRVAGLLNVPSQPARPVGIASASRQIDWSWTCPQDNGAQISGFDLQWRIQGGGWGSVVTTTYARYLLTGLTNGTTYEIRVRARNTEGPGPWSTVGSAAAAGQRPGGGATLALQATPGDAAVALNWLEPDDGGVAITRYEIQWRTSTQSYSTGRQETSSTTNHTVDPLTNETEYFFRVRAVNSLGGGPWSNEVRETPVEPPPEATVPERATAPTGASGNAEVTWTVTPPDDGNSQITGYEWRWRRVTSPTANWVSITTGASNTLRRTGLVNGSPYEAQVRATNSIGQQTQWSPSGTVTPRADAPDRILTIALDSATNGTSCTWGAPGTGGSAIIDYRLEWDDNESFSSPSSRVQAGTSYTITTGLTASGPTFFRVRARNQRGSGAWSPTFRTNVPDRAAAPVGASGGDGIATWTVQDPNDGAARITQYQWRWRRVNTPALSWNSVNTTAPTLRRTGLTNGQTYEAQVRVANSVGVQPTYSPSGTATPIAGRPDQIRSIGLQGTGTASTRASWTAPSDGGSAITSYTLEWDRSSSFNSDSGAPDGSRTQTGTSHTVSNLSSRTYFRVRATNSTGSADWSPTFSTNVPDRASAPVGTAGNTEATFTVSAPEENGAPISSYQWRWRLTGAENWNAASATGRTLSLTSLTNGRTYEAQVRASNAAGQQSTYSPSGTVRPQADAPGQIQNINLSVSGTGTRASWVQPPNNGASISSYTLQWDRSNSFNSDSGAPDGSRTQTGRNYAVLNLTAKTYFRVRATNSAGDGPWSPVYSTDVPDVMDAPNGTAGNAQITWNATQPDRNGAGITRYHWRYKRSSVSNWTASNETSASLTVSGLTNGSAYEAQVRASNAAGAQSQWSPSGSATPVADVPDQITSITLTNNQTNVSAAWGAPGTGGSPILDYTLEWDTSDDFDSDSGSPIGTRTQTGRTYSVTGLTTGTTYYFRVRARNARGSGTWSPAESIRRQPPQTRPDQVPAAPTGRVQTDCIAWSWQAPSDGGSVITGYDYQWRESGDSWDSDNIVAVDRASYTHMNLTPNQAYQVRVRAKNAIGTGDWSATGSARALPLSVTFTSAGTSTYTFPWNTARATATITAGSGGSGGGGGGGGGASNVNDVVNRVGGDGGDGGKNKGEYGRQGAGGGGGGGPDSGGGGGGGNDLSSTNNGSGGSGKGSGADGQDARTQSNGGAGDGGNGAGRSGGGGGGGQGGGDGGSGANGGGSGGDGGEDNNIGAGGGGGGGGGPAGGDGGDGGLGGARAGGGGGGGAQGNDGSNSSVSYGTTTITVVGGVGGSRRRRRRRCK